MDSIPPVAGIIYGLYCTCHPERGIRYVGQTTRVMKVRFSAHTSGNGKSTQRQIANWVRKHGRDNIRWFQISEAPNKQSLNAEEVYWIAALRKIGQCDLNIADGGPSATGFSHSQDARKRIGESSASRVRTETHRLRIGASNSGRTHTEEARAKMSIAKRAAHQKRIEAGLPSVKTPLSDSDIVQILDLFNYGFKQREIGELYGVTAKAISGITTGRNWRHVPR